MRIFALIAALALVSATSAQAGDSRSLSMAGVDGKVPTALGKAADAPKVVEAPRPPDPPRPPDLPKAAETPPAPPAAAQAPAAEVAPTYTPRPSVVGNKPDASKAGQVTFDDKSAAPADPAVTSTDKLKHARVEKPRRKRGGGYWNGGYWNEARIMREVYRYSGYAWMMW
jgi:type IV secretory pathway VirB10-like protein